MTFSNAMLGLLFIAIWIVLASLVHLLVDNAAKRHPRLDAFMLDMYRLSYPRGWWAWVTNGWLLALLLWYISAKHKPK